VQKVLYIRCRSDQSTKATISGVQGIMGQLVTLEPSTYGLPSHYCCLTNKQSIISGKEVIGSMKLIFTIYESAQTGKAIEPANL